MIPKVQGSSSQAQTSYPDEMTLQEFVLGLVDILRWLKSHWWKLGLVMLMCIGGFLYNLFNKEPEYRATLTCILSDDHSGGIGGLGSVLGQFGLPANSGKYNINKLLEIAKSRTIVSRAILSEVTIEGRTGLLGNFLIENLDLDQEWSEKNPEMEGFRFQKAVQEGLNIKENYAIKQLHKLIVGSSGDRSNALLQMDYGKTDYVMSFITTTLDPSIAIHTSRLMFERLKEFYIFQATEKYQTSFDVLQIKRDSLAKAYQKTELQIAKFKDQSAKTFEYSNNVTLSNLSTESLGLKLALAEIEKSLALAEMALKNSTPMIQLIDEPIGPLSPLPKPLLRTIIIGGVIGLVLYLAFIFMWGLARMV
ncbi:MAG: hypothetical protein ACI9FN_002744 [Saprospiraceae bacterium]